MRQTSLHRTIDHHIIRDWAELRAGYPVHESGKAAALGIAFRGESNETKGEPVSWDDFFHEFDERRLCFIYEERTVSGALSHKGRFARDEGTEPRGPH
jgi:hypothetical protein